MLLGFLFFMEGSYPIFLLHFAYMEEEYIIVLCNELSEYTLFSIILDLASKMQFRLQLNI